MSYNTFRGRKTDGLFVYGLTNKGAIFYVGTTGYLACRYREHFGNVLLCSQYIYQMRAKGEYPGIVIFGIFDTIKEAEATEHGIIRALSYVGNKLLNNHQNPHPNKLEYDIEDVTSRPKNMPPRLLNEIVNKAIEDYNQFRKWEPFAIWQRLRLENTQQSTTQ